MYARWTDFVQWRDNSYNPGISKLVTEFVTALSHGRVLGIAPLLGLYKHLHGGQRVTRIMCGAGASSFNIATGGTITACPIAPEFESLGDIAAELDPNTFRDRQMIRGECPDCDILHKCGGRCLYCNHTEWWGHEGFIAVCNTVRHIISEVETRVMPLLDAAVRDGTVNAADVLYPVYNNSVEIMYVMSLSS